jgi:hypothetical protein
MITTKSGLYKREEKVWKKGNERQKKYYYEKKRLKKFFKEIICGYCNKKFVPNKKKEKFCCFDCYAKYKTEIPKFERKGYRNCISGKYANYKNAAKSRGFEFNLTLKEFSSFWQKPCTYCGAEIKTIGIDRIDSSKGYYMENCVSCCCICNRMKTNYTTKDFIKHCEDVYMFCINKDYNDL